jgi:hypothetical protein
MLTRLIRATVLAAAAAVALLAVMQLPALASGGPGGGGPFGGVQCGQSYSPSCVVTAGSAQTSATTGTDANGGQAGSTLAATGGGAGGGSGCAGTVSKAFGCVPAGCTITVQTLACPVGVAGAPAAGPAPPAPPPPAVLAQLAVRYLRLPDPVIRSSPAPGAPQLTELPTWMWVAPAAWRPESKTAQVPGEAVTATATPVSASWQMGDGRTVTCHGPGTPYSGGGNPAASSPTCGYTYTRSSAGQPSAAYHVTVTITWDITWAGPGGAGGVLPPLFTAAAAAMRVAESQAVDTAGGT